MKEFLILDACGWLKTNEKSLENTGFSRLLTWQGQKDSNYLLVVLMVFFRVNKSQIMQEYQ